MDHPDALNGFRARLELEQRDAQERRERYLRDQRSVDATPAARIAIWERLHGLRLPKDPAHRILDIVARDTGLALSQVLDVQVARAQPAALPQP